MTETSTDPAATLRRAAELAPQVLPPEIGAAVTQKITFALDSPTRVADLHPHYARLAAEVLALADPGEIRTGSVELTPEQVEEFKARFEAVKKGPPKILANISREEVRYLLMDAYGLGMDDAENEVRTRSHEDLHRTLAAGDQKSAQYLRAAYILAQDGEQS